MFSNFGVPFKTPVCYFLCYFDRMKRTETYRDKKKPRAGRTTTREAVKYQKVHDGRKRRIRGLWNRGGAFYAQLSLPNEDGVRKMRRVKLNATTVASATDELRRMVIDRDDDQLPAMVRKPRFDNYAQDYIDREYALGRKTDRTLNTESGHINFWRKQFGETRLNKITPKMIQEGLIRRKATGVSPRTLNLSLTTLRNVLRSAIDEGWMVESPARRIKWQKVPRKNRQLFTSSQLELLCKSAKEESVNHQLFCDFVRFLCFSGARIGEAMPLSWADVDFKRSRSSLDETETPRTRSSESWISTPAFAPICRLCASDEPRSFGCSPPHNEGVKESTRRASENPSCWPESTLSLITCASTTAVTTSSATV